MVERSRVRGHVASNTLTAQTAALSSRLRIVWQHRQHQKSPLTSVRFFEASPEAGFQGGEGGEHKKRMSGWMDNVVRVACCVLRIP